MSVTITSDTVALGLGVILGVLVVACGVGQLYEEWSNRK